MGLGYVGSVTAACLARDGHDVLGIDLDPAKLDLLRAGKAPIVEAEINDITAAAVGSGRLVVEDRLDRRIGACDVVFVCVGTPSAANGSQDLRAIERVATQIGEALSHDVDFPVIVLRSTVPPGSTEGVMRPILESASGKRAGTDFGLCFQPEFLREGSSVKDFYQPPFTVVGGDEASVAPLERLFAEFPGEFVTTDIRSAELLKVACNSFHALKVAFANEIGRLGQSLGIDSRQVMELLCRDTRLNISSAYLRPGFAFGGSCLPKDLRALLYLAKSHDAELPMLRGILPSNAIPIERAASMVMDGGSRKVGMIGLSFKQGTDDLRESPLVALAERLIGKGYELRIYDPAVSLALLTGSNKRYIDETIPHIGSLLVGDLSTLLDYAETLVLGHRSQELGAALERCDAPPRRIVDLVGMDSGLAAAEYVGVSW